MAEMDRIEAAAQKPKVHGTVSAPASALDAARLVSTSRSKARFKVGKP
jgi:hypothetical protein